MFGRKHYRDRIMVEGVQEGYLWYRCIYSYRVWQLFSRSIKLSVLNNEADKIDSLTTKF